MIHTVSEWSGSIYFHIWKYILEEDIRCHVLEVFFSWSKSTRLLSWSGSIYFLGLEVFIFIVWKQPVERRKRLNLCLRYFPVSSTNPVSPIFSATKHLQRQLPVNHHLLTLSTFFFISSPGKSIITLETYVGWLSSKI